MNKQTTTILGVGALAVVGYLVYKQMSKPKSFANFRGTGMPLARCRKSPTTAPIPDSNVNNRRVYECCSPGVIAYAPSSVKCDTGGTAGSATALSDSLSTGGRNF